MKYLVAVFCFLVFIAVQKSMAQNSDARWRVGVRLEKDISKKLELNLETQVRFKNNWFVFDKIFVEPAIKYHINKKWQSGIIFRIEQKQNLLHQVYGGQRASVFMGAKYPVRSDWEIKAKTTIQYQTRSFFGKYDPSENQLMNRSQFSLGYDFFGKPYSLESGSEIFYEIKTNSHFDRWRWFAEIKYSLAQKSDILVHYIIDKKRTNIRTVDHILMFLYRYKI